MAEQYFFVKMLLMYIGAGLVILLLIGAGVRAGRAPPRLLEQAKAQQSPEKPEIKSFRRN